MFYVELFRRLEEAGVRYLVVGGVAVNLHGVNRLTHDVDLMLAFGLRPQNPVEPTVDILVNSPVEFEAAYARRVVVDVSGQNISVASIADIITMKSGTGRAKDQDDIAMLKRLWELDGTRNGR